MKPITLIAALLLGLTCVANTALACPKDDDDPDKKTSFCPKDDDDPDKKTS